MASPPDYKSLCYILAIAVFLLSLASFSSLQGAKLFGQVFVEEAPVLTDTATATLPETSLTTATTQSTSSGASQCSQNGTRVCRCYCRTNLQICNNGNLSYSSLPLCKQAWAGNDCNAIGYYHTEAADGMSCQALNGTSCEGYIRSGNGNPADLAGQQVEGSFLGCEVVTL